MREGGGAYSAAYLLWKLVSGFHQVRIFEALCVRFGFLDLRLECALW